MSAEMPLALPRSPLSKSTSTTKVTNPRIPHASTGLNTEPASQRLEWVSTTGLRSFTPVSVEEATALSWAGWSRTTRIVGLFAPWRWHPRGPLPRRSRLRCALQDVGSGEVGGAGVVGQAMELPMEIDVAVRRDDDVGGRPEGRGLLHRVQGAHVEGGHAARLGDAHTHDAPVLLAQHDLEVRAHVFAVQRVILGQGLETREEAVCEDRVDAQVDRVEIAREGHPRGVQRRLVAHLHARDVVLEGGLPALESEGLPGATMGALTALTVEATLSGQLVRADRRDGHLG